MKHYAICELKNGEFECIQIYKVNVLEKYKEIVNNAIKQLKSNNEIRNEQYKIIKLVDVVGHGNGFTPHQHLVWSEQRCEEAKTATFPIYDFEHPENGIEY